MDRISSREPYISLSEKWLYNTGDSGRCQDIKDDIETFRSPVGFPADRQWQVSDLAEAADNTALSTETLTFVQKMITENLQLREEKQNLYTNLRAQEAIIGNLSREKNYIILPRGLTILYTLVG